MRILLLSWVLLSAACSMSSPKNSNEIKSDEQNLTNVEEVQITGNSVFPTEELRKIIEITPGLKESKKLDETINLDIDRLRFEYLNFGYFRVKVVGPDKETLKNSNIKIIFKIDEGSQYFVRDVRFRGDLFFSESKLKKLLNFKKGEPYSFKKLTLYLEALNKEYKAAKYPFVSITPEPIVDESKKEIDTIFEIHKGKRQP